MDELVEVTQADRDAAAPHTTGFGHIDGYSFSTLHMVRAGHCDDHPIVQAFARHRLAAIAAARPAILEEAAKVAEVAVPHFKGGREMIDGIATAIRAMKGKG